MAHPLTPEEEARVNSYWGVAPGDPGGAPVPIDLGDIDAPAPVDLGDVDAPGFVPVRQPTSFTRDPRPVAAAYQPNPGAPGYNPNPGAATSVAPQAPRPAMQPLGAPPPPPGPAPIDIGDIDYPEPVNLGDVDAPGFMGAVRQPIAFERSVEAPVKPRAARGPATPPNPDPYGVKAAQTHLLGTYDAEMAAQRQLAGAQGVKATMMADAHREMGRRREEDASIANLENDLAAENFQKQTDELSRQLDDVRTRKIQPITMMDKGPAMAIGSVIASAIGGFYQGLNHLASNPIIDQIDRIVERQMAADEKNLENEKGGIKDKLSLLGQQRAALHDTQTAKMAARNLYYEAAKQALEGEAQQYDSSVYKANSEASIAQIDRAQAQVQQQLALAAQQRAMAAAGRATAQRKEVMKEYRAVYDKVLEQTQNPAVAEAEAKRQIGVLFAPGSVGERAPSVTGADPIANVPKDQRSEAMKELSEYSKAEKGIAAIRTAGAKLSNLPATSGPWDRDRGALESMIAGAYKNALGPGMSSDKDFDTFIKPNIPQYGESDATKAQKLRNIESVIRGKVATPLLDTHNPNWRQPTAQETNARLGAKPVR